MLKCDITTCQNPAAVLVHFKTGSTPYPYCEAHGTKWGQAHHRFGRMVGSGPARRWVTAVRNEQRVTPNQ